jgi:hypothetical protein
VLSPVYVQFINASSLGTNQAMSECLRVASVSVALIVLRQSAPASSPLSAWINQAVVFGRASVGSLTNFTALRHTSERHRATSGTTLHDAD